MVLLTGVLLQKCAAAVQRLVLQPQVQLVCAAAPAAVHAFQAIRNRGECTAFWSQVVPAAAGAAGGRGGRALAAAGAAGADAEAGRARRHLEAHARPGRVCLAGRLRARGRARAPDQARTPLLAAPGPHKDQKASNQLSSELKEPWSMTMPGTSSANAAPCVYLLRGWPQD